MSVRTTRRALERWAVALPAAHERADVLGALTAVGGALRLGIEIPAPLRGWMTTLEQSDVEAALAPLAAEAAGWGLAEGAVSPSDRRRPDDAESARRAVMRIAMSKGWTVSSIAHLETLRAALQRIDEHRANGAADEDRAAPPLELGPLADGSVRDAVPDDDIVLSYVRRGALARYVEGVALQNPAFAEELRACIDALVETGEQVGDAARKWHGGLAPARSPSAESGDASVARAQAAQARSAKVVSILDRRWTIVASVSLAATVLLAVGGGSYYVQQRDAARVQAAKDRELAEKQAELDALRAALERQEEAVALAQAEAASAKSDADRRAAQQKLSAALAEQRKTAGALKAGALKQPSSPRAACTCQAGDPLCSCL